MQHFVKTTREKHFYSILYNIFIYKFNANRKICIRKCNSYGYYFKKYKLVFYHIYFIRFLFYSSAKYLCQINECTK